MRTNGRSRRAEAAASMADPDSDAAKMRTMALFEVTELEEKVVEPYLKLGNESAEVKLAKLGEQTQVLLRTNMLLQGKLTEEDLICKELEDRHDELGQHEEVLHSERRELKRLEEEVREQLRAIGQGRRSEKIRLETAQLDLAEELSRLTAERARLANQDREERGMIERQARMIESSEGEVISLREKKEWLALSERSNEFLEGGGIMDESITTKIVWGGDHVGSKKKTGRPPSPGAGSRDSRPESPSIPKQTAAGSPPRPQSPNFTTPGEGQGTLRQSPNFTTPGEGPRRKVIASQKGNREALPTMVAAGSGSVGHLSSTGTAGRTGSPAQRQGQEQREFSTRSARAHAQRVKSKGSRAKGEEQAHP